MQKEPAGTTKMAIVVAIVAIIVASVALLAVSKLQKNGAGESAASTTGEGRAPAVSGKGGTSLGLNYTQALALYDSGYRFQFSSCSGTPGTLNVAAGATLMLDNRDAAAHVIKVGSTSYSIGAYGFRIINAGAKAKDQITCDGKGAAVLNVQ